MKKHSEIFDLSQSFSRRNMSQFKRRIVRTRLPIAVPVVLTVAGSDCSGGAGMQADLKTLTTLGCYGTSAVTCVVAEHPGRVEAIQVMPPRLVRRQIELVAEAFPIATAKTGMLPTVSIMRVVVRAMRDAPFPWVVDPVMVASSGAALMDREAVRFLRDHLLPLARVVTPNRDEAALLWGRAIQTHAQLVRAGTSLARDTGVAFLVKGGHLQRGEAVDYLCTADGTVRAYRAPRMAGVDPHGTGCTMSAALAAGLAKGLTLPAAVALAKRFITRAIRRRFRVGVYDLLNPLPDP
jgi:hydroxymethylpyrimidine/phosphomethylpyrimidine kinase